MNWKKIIGFWILGAALIIGIFWLGREFYYYKHPVISYAIATSGEKGTGKYLENCIFELEKTSRFGMEKKLVEQQKHTSEAIMELMLRMKEKYPSREKYDLRLEFSFENNITKIAYKGMITDTEGTEFQVEESVQVDGILTKTVKYKSQGSKWDGVGFKAVIAVCCLLWLGVLVFIGRRKGSG